MAASMTCVRPCCQVLLTSLPCGTTETELRRILSSLDFLWYGIIEDVKIKGPGITQPRPGANRQQSKDLTATINFQDERDAINATQALLDDKGSRIHGRRMKPKCSRWRTPHECIFALPFARDAASPSAATVAMTTIVAPHMPRGFPDGTNTASEPSMSITGSPRQALPIVLEALIPTVEESHVIPRVEEGNIDALESVLDRIRHSYDEGDSQLTASEQEEIVQNIRRVQDILRYRGMRGPWALLDEGRLRVLFSKALMLDQWADIEQLLSLDPTQILVVAPTNLECLPYCKEEVRLLQSKFPSDRCLICHSLHTMEELLATRRFSVVHIVGDSAVEPRGEFRSMLRISDDGPITSDSLLNYFSNSLGRPSVVLNFCRSLPLARKLLMSSTLTCAIGRAADVQDCNAFLFARELYCDHGWMSSVEQAFEDLRARARLGSTLPCWWEGMPELVLPSQGRTISLYRQCLRYCNTYRVSIIIILVLSFCKIGHGGLGGAGKGSYYKQVKGVKYDASLLDEVHEAGKDGHISCTEAEHLWRSAQDGNRVTRIEGATLQYALHTYEFAEPAKLFFVEKLSTVKPS